MRSETDAQVHRDLTAAEARLAAIESLLGLLASECDRDGRATFLAFQIAGGSPAGQIEHTMRELEELAPGWLREAEDFARDMHGQDAAAILRRHESPVTAHGKDQH